MVCFSVTGTQRKVPRSMQAGTTLNTHAQNLKRNIKNFILLFKRTGQYTGQEISLNIARGSTW